LVPHDLETYFSVSAALAGTLIGLLFVSITLRYDDIFNRGYRHRARATSAFITLVDALVISLWALIPSINLGYPAAIAGAAGLAATIRLHIGPSGRRDTSTVLFVASVTGMSAQIALGCLLALSGNDRGYIDGLTYAVFYAVVIGLVRAWQLIQPGPATQKESDDN
jgi:hypothetical protein